jgi:hypothetical protein
MDFRRRVLTEGAFQDDLEIDQVYDEEPDQQLDSVEGGAGMPGGTGEDEDEDEDGPIDMNKAMKNHEEIYFINSDPAAARFNTEGNLQGAQHILADDDNVKPTSIPGVTVVGEDLAQPPSQTDSQLCEIDAELDSNDSHSGDNNIFTNYRMLRIPGDDESEEEDEEEGGVKFMCPETGAHFEFGDMCGRMDRLGSVREQLELAVQEEMEYYRQVEDEERQQLE